MGRRRIESVQRITGDRWTATKQAGLVTIQLGAVSPETVATLPVGWRPPGMIHATVISAPGDDRPVARVSAQGELGFLRCSEAVYGQICYQAA